LQVLFMSGGFLVMVAVGSAARVNASTELRLLPHTMSVARVKFI
jgi:hypothetical protein